MKRSNHCVRCGQPHPPNRTFCPNCGLADQRRLGIRTSTEDSRDRALAEIDRACGVTDYARYEREYAIDIDAA